MNLYRISYETHTGDTGNASIPETTESRARDAFKKSMKVAGYTSSEMPRITGVELIRTDASATKDQERAALAKIRSIVADLGPDSYIATAFEGCFDDAEQNIDNDFALSMNGRWQDAEQKAEGLRAQLKEAMDEVESIRSSTDKAITELSDKLRAELADHAETKKALQEQKISTDAEHKFRLAERSKMSEKDREISVLKAEVHDRDMTIMELKAKLYDLMVKEEQK